MACIGVGNVGRSWAIVFARAGWDVALWDAHPEAAMRALALIRASVADLEQAGLLADPPGTLARVAIADNLAAAVAGADYIQESASEDVSVKRALFAEIDAAADPGAIIASSTSAIPGSAFLEDIAGRQRCPRSFSIAKSMAFCSIACNGRCLARRCTWSAKAIARRMTSTRC